LLLAHVTELSYCPVFRGKKLRLPGQQIFVCNILLLFQQFLNKSRVGFANKLPRSSFEIAGPLSQVFNLGVLAQQLNTKLVFDRETKQITNNKMANQMLVGAPPRKGWEEFYKL
jgi:hypothetical protein